MWIGLIEYVNEMRKYRHIKNIIEKLQNLMNQTEQMARKINHVCA